MATLLDLLRSSSVVDCDTLDLKVAQTLGPFVDCTSNQAIAFAELGKLSPTGEPLYEPLMRECIQTAHWMLSKHPDATLEELAVELMTVSLSLQFAPYLTGYHHIQTNPKWSYSAAKTISNAERILAHFEHLSPGFDRKRVCIKVPSTWEGMQACRELEKRGIATLATTAFCMEQAMLAADAGCTYIAPYVNELRVHFDPGYVDPAKAFSFCATAQQYYQRHGHKIKVLPASLTSISDVLQLAGAHHITVSPPLLAEMAATPAEGWVSLADVGKAFQIAAAATTTMSGDGLAREKAHAASIVGDEARWRLAFTRSGAGTSEGKIVQAINIFCDMQDSLEEMVRKMDVAAK